MTEIYIELGGKKAIAWSLEWPGWCRIRTSEAAAVQALIETEVRYRLIAQRAGLKFAPGDLMVVERLPGDANTAWGVPSVLAPAETRPIDVVTAQRNVSLLRAAWDMLEEVVMASSAELRKGPRGGGRDRDGIWHHVIEAERACARKIGVRRPPFEVNDKSALKAMREEIAAVLSNPRQPAASCWLPGVGTPVTRSGAWPGMWSITSGKSKIVEADSCGAQGGPGQASWPEFGRDALRSLLVRGGCGR